MRRLELFIAEAFAWAAMAAGVWAEAERPVFKSLRYDEDYSFLKDPAERSGFWDGVKYLPVADEHAGFLSFGGELRERFESYENEFFRTAPDADNAYLMQRYLLHADYHVSDRFRIFGQLQSSLEDGRPGGPRATDRDTADLHQLFADVVIFTRDERSLTMRVGRQEMSYGSERLISVREGTNSRRAFDAIRLLYRQGESSVDLFFSSPVEVDPGAFDDQHIRDLWFWGAYATMPFPSLSGIKLDLYYLGVDNPRARFSQGSGREERHTLGARFFGTRGRWDFNHEALYQFGRFAEGDITAWSVATDHGYTLSHLWGRPRLGLKAAIASGDRDRASRDLQTLNPLFPRGNYFTEASLLGPQNFIDLHPCLRLQPARNWTVDLGSDFYWRESREDGIYTPGGGVIYEGNPSFSRFVGTDLSLAVTWQATRHVQVAAAYTHFFAGSFIRENGGEDVDFGMISVSVKF
ncbi:alginate export protein [Roseimicrobium gellanilyticum]|uniref:Alginate export protein n=1 Tax=Roseimicrobium gellanilyticum TaxID=748857 RepID=A0A366H5F2_9BACT|nr:alginate export family protein [Roseimicrobium gellanilyticum]RBP37297.1 alginate export protein [Roseimicrobium gellanilyticum]